MSLSPDDKKVLKQFLLSYEEQELLEHIVGPLKAECLRCCWTRSSDGQIGLDYRRRNGSKGVSHPNDWVFQIDEFIEHHAVSQEIADYLRLEITVWHLKEHL